MLKLSRSREFVVFDLVLLVLYTSIIEQASSLSILEQCIEFFLKECDS